MNVRELIAELEKFDPDLTVSIRDEDMDFCEVEIKGEEKPLVASHHPFLVLRGGGMLDY